MDGGQVRILKILDPALNHFSQRITHTSMSFLLFQKLASAKNPMVVVGSALLQRNDGAAILKAVSGIAQTARVKSGCDKNWRVLNVLQRVSLFAGLILS